MYGYIYKTTNLINGKFYIGKHKADKHDPSYLGSGNYISAAIQKYGCQNFKNELIDTANSLEELNCKERFWIAELNACSLGYNIAPGGDGGEVWGDPKNHPSLGKPGCKGAANGWYGKQHSPEVRAALAANSRGRRKVISPDGTIKHVKEEEIDAYISQGWACPYRLEQERREAKGPVQHGHKPGTYHHSEETRRKIGDAHRGKKHPSKFHENFHAAIQNRSEERKQEIHEKLSKSHLGKHNSEESRRKVSETLKRKYASGEIKSQKGRVAWNKGVPSSTEVHARLAAVAVGRIHITDGVHNKMIHPEEFDEYESKGWKKGRTLLRKTKGDLKDA